MPGFMVYEITPKYLRDNCLLGYAEIRMNTTITEPVYVIESKDTMIDQWTNSIKDAEEIRTVLERMII